MISIFQWIVDGRKNFTGPRGDMTIDGLNTLVSEQESGPISKEKETSPPRFSNTPYPQALDGPRC